MFLDTIAPKKFLCLYPLRLGALCVSVLMIVEINVAVVPPESNHKGFYDLQKNLMRQFNYNARCISVICGFALLGQILKFDDCLGCPRYVWKNSYGFSVTAIVYSLIMLGVHIWLIFGVKCEKSSIILSWVVMTSMWLALTLCLLIVLICMYSTETNFVAWLLCLIFGLIAIGMLVYTVLVVYGFWLELKEKEKNKKLVVTTETN